MAVAFLLAVSAILVLAQPPARWAGPLATLNRAQVHALLGIPDADFLPKGWDGWDKPVLIGAWVLTVYYDDQEHVTSARTKFDWGLGHLSWDRDYQKRLATAAATRKKD